MSTPKALICPYCGEAQPVGTACRACGGVFEKLSRQASHNAMGPWFIRDDAQPFRPGCSYETLVALIERGQVHKNTIVRGPTTTQFWNIARRVPGIAHLFGHCHQCSDLVDPEEHGCAACGAPFGAYLDRNFLGLPDVRPLPWEAPSGEEHDSGHAATAGGGHLRNGGAASAVGHARMSRRDRLSSFATNEELRGDGPVTVTANPPAPGDDHRPAPHRASPSPIPPAPLPGSAPLVAHADALPDTHPQAGPDRRSGPASVEPYAGPAGMRALQRRVAHQARTIRTLTVLIVVGFAGVAVTAIAFANVWLNPNREQFAVPDPLPSARTAAEPLAPTGTETATNEDESPTPASDAAVEPPSASESIVSPPAEADPLEGTAAIDDLATAVDPWREQWEHALTLADDADDPEKPRDECIEACGLGLAIIDRIVVEAPADEQPDDIADLRERIVRRLERLKLDEFFP